MKLTLKEKKQETPDVVTFIFESETNISWQAGQFLHYTLRHQPTDSRGSERWFTISSAPYEGNPQITTRFTQSSGSSFKNSLKDLKVGAEIEAEGPEGDFTLNNPDKDYVFIAGGIGITPFHSILKQLDHEGKRLSINLIYANKSEDNIPFKKELEQLASRHPEFKINLVIEPERIDEKKIRQLIPDLSQSIFYVSGPEPMVDSLGKTLTSMGVRGENLKQDWFPGYTQV